MTIFSERNTVDPWFEDYESFGVEDLVGLKLFSFKLVNYLNVCIFPFIYLSL